MVLCCPLLPLFSALALIATAARAVRLPHTVESWKPKYMNNAISRIRDPMHLHSGALSLPPGCEIWSVTSSPLYSIGYICFMYRKPQSSCSTLLSLV
jgi:hypothetical protein